MAKILMWMPPILFAGLAGLFIAGMERDDPDGLPSALTGKAAPLVQLTPFGDAAAFTDADLRAPGPKLVNFWASWCAPCRAEHPLLEQLAVEGVAIYGVNYKDRLDDAQGFLSELGNPYTAIGQDAGRMALDWGVYGVPETYVIDGDGRIVLRFAGPISAAELERTIRPAIAKASEKPD
ncbi:cytochrome c biogenesis protein CcmG, thiol:disulfide interchange protein DsbE [Pseudorhodobacter antarcticus]|jgi:cytochrome c biogenesis protein CcmG/thiol:disulfide interchange protein DsbE|uniref:Cytochrome c biogenesis protein CcmG, thiol:disulfide interchange protein DsbE n=1 Tax=Pseudorhodobacter antarcticus TaxID=1077947 RepID=A0A1H8D596_9RHOB|nr:DsbE family thiol:disulfide interchange protein [Pseudorhodobacter antarcticus]SEN02501.1 cytochrome c biogenesis protein CcmG, thiol:disulfide interchange protein DsbE [Pseudorhodobacter antarcticus]